MCYKYNLLNVPHNMLYGIYSLKISHNQSWWLYHQLCQVTRRLYTLACRTFSLSCKWLYCNPPLPSESQSSCALICSILNAKRVYLLEITSRQAGQAPQLWLNTLGAFCCSVVGWLALVAPLSLSAMASCFAYSPSEGRSWATSSPALVSSTSSLLSTSTQPFLPFVGGYRSYQAVILRLT